MESKGKPIELGGQLVRSIFEMPVTENCNEFIFRRLGSIDEPIQGVCIKIPKGEIYVNGQAYSEVVFWADTSPEEIIVKISPGLEGIAKIWNAWKRGGIMSAWTGNAALRVTKVDRLLRFECSDGVGDVNFSDLTFEIEWKR